jgi:hypothetical protein
MGVALGKRNINSILVCSLDLDGPHSSLGGGEGLLYEHKTSVSVSFSLGFGLVWFGFFETGFLCVALAVLELTL